jgi:hypothetical protein
LAFSNRIRHQERSGREITFQPAIERPADLLRLRRLIVGPRRPDCLNGRAVNGIAHPHIDKIQAQQADQPVEQCTDNLGYLVAAPTGGQGEDADQIINAALQAFDFRGCLFHFYLSREVASGNPRGIALRSRNSRKNSSGGIKKGFSWRRPPMMIIGWVRMMSMMISPPNLARS